MRDTTSPPQSHETEIVEHAPDLDAMTRADAPAIWNDFRAQVEKFKATAETLVVTHENQLAEMRLARATRLTLKDIRVAIEKRRKELGEEYLRKTKEINAAANELKAMIEPLESRLLDQEKFAERAEQARREQLGKDRASALAPYIVVNQVIPNIADMTEEQFAGMLADAKILHEAKIEAARKAEEDRIAKEKAEAEERERIRMENERLKREAAEKEAALAAERARVESEKKGAEETARKEREAIEAKKNAEIAEIAGLARIEQEKKDREAAAWRAAQEEKFAKLRAQADNERKEREAAEAKIAAQKAEAEERARAEQEAKAAVEAAPDREKAKAFAAALRELEIPRFSTTRWQNLREQISNEIYALSEKIENAAAGRDGK